MLDSAGMVRLKASLLFAWLFCAALMAATPELASFSIDLKKGDNLVSVPVTMTAAARRVDLLFGSIIDDVDAVWYYDADKQQWRVWSPHDPTAGVAPVLPDLAGCCLQVDKDVTWQVTGQVRGDTDPLLPALKLGWQLVGVGALSQNAGTNAWEPRPVALADLVPGNAAVTVDSEIGPDGKHLLTQDPLLAGQAYWLHGVASPGGGGDDDGGNVVTKGDDDDDDFDNLPQYVQDQYTNHKADYPTPSDDKKDLQIGDYVVKYASYKEENGHRMAGMGVIEELPANAAQLIELNGGKPFFVYLDCRDDKAVGAYAEGSAFSEEAQMTGDVTVGGATTVHAGDVLYLTIYESKRYPHGVAEMAARLANPITGKKGDGVIRVFSPSPSDAVHPVTYWWSDYSPLLGEETFVSKVWKVDDATVTAMHPDGGWLLGMPAGAEGLFELNSKVPDHDPDDQSLILDPGDWFPCKLDDKNGVLAGDSAASPKVTKVCLARNWLGNIGSVENVTSGSLSVDQDGEIDVILDDSVSTRLTYNNGQLEYSPKAWDHFHLWLRPDPVTHLGFSMGADFIVRGGTVTPQNYTIEDLDVQVTVSPRLLSHMREQMVLHPTGGFAKSMMNGLAIPIYLAWPTGPVGEPSEEAWNFYNGTGASVSIDLNIAAKNTKGVEFDIPISLAASWYIRPDSVCEYRYDLQAGFSVDSDNFGVELMVKAFQDGTITVEGDGDQRHRVKQPLQHSITTELDGAFAPPSDLPAWGGSMVSISERTQINGRIGPLDAGGTRRVEYKALPVTVVTQTDNAKTKLSDQDYSFQFDSMRFESRPIAWGCDYKGFLPNTIGAMLDYVVGRVEKPTFGDNKGRLPALCYPKRSSVTASLEVPEDLATHFEGMSAIVELEYDDPTKSAFNFPDSFSAVIQVNGVFNCDKAGLKFIFHELVLSAERDWQGRWQLLFSGAAELNDGETQVDTNFTIYKAADGWMLQATVEDLPCISKAFPYGRLHDETFIVPLREDNFWKDFQLLVSGSIDNEEIRQKLGLDDGIEISGMVTFPTGNFKEPMVTLSCASIPLHNLDDLKDKLSGIGCADLESLSNIVIQVSKGGNFTFSMDGQFVFGSYVVDPKTPRADWPRTTLGITCTYTVDGDGGRSWDYEVHGQNVVVTKVGDDGLFELTTFHADFSPQTKAWEIGVTAHMKFPTDWKDWVKKANFAIPDEIDLDGEYFHGTRSGWQFSAKCEHSFSFGGFDLTLENLTVTKASPWALGFTGNLGYGGKSYAGSASMLPTGGFRFSLPSDTSIDFSLPGDVADVSLGNLALVFAEVSDIEGTATVTLPDSNPLANILGKSLTGTLAVGPSGFGIGIAIDGSVSQQLGPLGTAGIALKNLTVRSDGVFDGNGSMTLSGHTVDLTVGMRGTSVSVLADFGDKGVDLKLAGLFDLAVRNQLGFMSIGPAQVVKIDSGTLSLGPVPWYGFEYAAEDLYYILPTTIPPIGFGFFKTLSGKAYMYGFAINVSLSFPPPTLSDMGLVVGDLSKAFAGGSVDWTNLAKLSAPSMGIQDVYLEFPKVPGMTYQSGQFQETDDLFKSIFGTDRLTFIDSLSVGPRTVVGIATAKDTYDVLDALIPPDKRQGSKDVNLRGFAAGASYDLRPDTSTYENKAIDAMPAVNRFIERVRYVDENAGDTPSDLQGGGVEIGFWSANDFSLFHRCGKAETARSVEDQYAYLLRHCFWTSNEFLMRNLDYDQFEALSRQVFGPGVDTIVANLSKPLPFQTAPRQVTIPLLQAAITNSNGCLDNVLGKFTPDGDRLSLDAIDDGYQTWFGRPGDKGGMVYWRRTAYGDSPWVLDESCTDCGLYGPYVHCDQGAYQAEFTLKAPSVQSTNTIVHVDVAINHGTTIAQKDLRGVDFRFPDKYQAFALDFTLDSPVDDVELRVWRRSGGPVVTIQSVRLRQAGKAEFRTVTLPDDLGGGDAKVSWQAADVRDELKNVQDIADALSLPKDTPWQDYLSHIWSVLKNKDSHPAANANRIGFSWSGDWEVDIAVNLVDEQYQVTGLRLQDGKVQYRASRAQLYKDSYFQGGSGDLTDDHDHFPVGDVGNDAASSIKLDPGARVVLYKDANYGGTSIELHDSVVDLGSTKVGNDSVSSARVWFDLDDWQQASDWRCVATSVNGTQLVIDAGAMQVVFPGGQRLLWLPPESRLAAARSQAGDAVNRLAPAPTFWDRPHDYLLDVWNRLLLPNSGKAEVESDVTLVFPTYGTDSQGNQYVRYKIGLAPFATTDGRKTTGIRFSNDDKQLFARYGTVTLYQDTNYGGSRTVVTDDMSSLSGGHGQVGDNDVSSIKCDDGGKIMLYENAGYKTWSAWKHWALKSAHPSSSYLCVWSGDDLIVNADQNGSFVSSFDILQPNLSDWGTGHYRFHLPVKLTSYGNISTGWSTITPSQDTSFLSIKVQPGSYQWQSHAWQLQDLDYGHRQELVWEYTLSNHYKNSPLVWTFSREWANSAYQIYGDEGFTIERETQGTPTETLTASDPDLRDNTIGNDTLSSVQVWFPEKVENLENYTLSHSLEARGTVQAVYRSLVTGKPAESNLVATLTGTTQRILIDRDSSGRVVVSAANSMKMVYPLSGYTLYLGGDTKQLDAIGDAADYVQIIDRRIEMPEDATVNQNIAGAWDTVFNGLPIRPNPADSGVSSCQFSVPDGPDIELQIPPGGGGFNRAKVVGTDNDYWPLYTNDDNLAAGVRKRLSGQPGGFFVTADLHAGDSDVVKLDITLSGSIENTGDFSLTGSSDLIIANQKLTDVEIELSSKDGLYIHGKLDLFEVAQAEVEGYIRPDGEFSLSGSASIVTGKSGQETGVKGAMAFCNDGIFVNGGIYLYGKCLRRGSFEMTSGQLSWSESYGIGFAGLDYTLTFYYSSKHFGLGFDAVLWVDVDIPIKIWGPTRWDCCCHDLICWPTHWGWHTVGDLDVNLDLHVTGELSNQEIKATLGGDVVKVGFDYNVTDHSLKVDW